jgi:hypothetical protein
MVRKKGIPVRNLKNDTLKILTERVEKIEWTSGRDHEANGNKE